MNHKLEEKIKAKIEERLLYFKKYTKDSTKVEHEYKEYMIHLEEILQQPINNIDYLWNDVVFEFAQKIEKAKKLLQQEEMNQLVTEKMFRNIDTFLERCKDSEFHIALVGAIKAGKSTLINALLGMDIASTNVTPETASLTKFKYSNRGNYIKVRFYTNTEWEQLWASVVDSKADVFLEEYTTLEAEKEKDNWINKPEIAFENLNIEALRAELKKWTSSKSAVHYFVKEVIVGLENFILSEGVVLVDTPGLDDPVEYRSNTTRDYINRANAVLVCVGANSLTGQELSTIYSVFSNTRYCPAKVYIIATQKDKLNKPNEEWKEQAIEWLKYLKGKGCYGSSQLAKNNLIGTSAYLYTLLSDIDNIEEGSDQEFELLSILFRLKIRQVHKNDENYEKLLRFTGIDRLRLKLKEEIIDHYRELQIKDIQENFDLCRAEIMSIAKNIKAQQEEIVDLVEKGIEEIRGRRQLCEEQMKKEKMEKVSLNGLLNQLYTETVERAKELSDAIKQLSE